MPSASAPSTLLRGLIVIAMFSGHKACGGTSEMAESSRESVRQGLMKLKGLPMWKFFWEFGIAHQKPRTNLLGLLRGNSAITESLLEKLATTPSEMAEKSRESVRYGLVKLSGLPM
jgi:hypothetical protein